MTLVEARNDWLLANANAVDEASKCIGKKGGFNPPLEKPWVKYDSLRLIADEKWYIFYNLTKKI